MSLGSMIAEALPDSAIEYVHDHPRVVYLITVPLLILAALNLDKAYRLQAHAELWVRGQVSGAARAASESLGG